MTKKIFLKQLRKSLTKMSRAEKNERIAFYSEMIDDRVEEGLSEKDAISDIGSVDKVASDVLKEIKLAKEERKQAKSGAKIALLICGFPIWFPILVSAFAIVLSLYVSYVALLIALWTVPLSLVLSALGAVVLSINAFICADIIYGLLLLAAALLCAGLSIFTFSGVCFITRSFVPVTKFFTKINRLIFRIRRIDI